jgi:hypothetical protein
MQNSVWHIYACLLWEKFKKNIFHLFHGKVKTLQLNPNEDLVWWNSSFGSNSIEKEEGC